MNENFIAAEEQEVERKLEMKNEEEKRKENEEIIILAATLTEMSDLVTSAAAKIKTTFELRKSNITGAGRGIFATEDLPEGYFDVYDGAFSLQAPADFTYTWSIKDESGDDCGYYDALRGNHWTKYVNCAASRDEENVYQHTIKNANFENGRNYIIYVTKAGIKKGDELLVYYGDAYAAYCVKVQKQAMKRLLK